MRTSFPVASPFPWLIAAAFAVMTSAGCSSSGTSSSLTPGQNCAVTIANAKGANNVSSGMQGLASGDWSAGDLVVVCNNLSNNFVQTLHVSLTGASPKVGAT